MRTLRLGAKGSDVGKWQAVVGAHVDGFFGAKTAMLTRAWQRDHGLDADGVVGPATWEEAIAAPALAPVLPPGPKARQAVLDCFYEENAPIEGVIAWMYADQAGDVTVGVGCLLPSPAEAIALRFLHDGGAVATPAEVEGDWRAVKGNKRAARLGACSGYARNLVKLHLSDAAIRDLVRTRLLANVDYVARHRFPNFANLNANGQLALMLWCWGPGPASPAPKMFAALTAEEYAVASAECHLDPTGNPGLIPRNKRMETLLLGAVTVKANGLDPDVIYEET